MRRPLLLLPRPLDTFVLGDHARELAETSGGAVALPGRVPYGALVRSPGPLRSGVARSIARSLERSVPADWTPEETVLVAYHAIQWPAVEALLARGVASEVWYCRWDRYECAHDAGRPHELLDAWHDQLATASTLIFTVSGKLAELEHEAGREALVVGLSADDFPDGPLEPGGHGAELVAAAVKDAHLAPATGLVEAGVIDAAGRPAALAINNQDDGSRPDAGAHGSRANVLASAPVAVSRANVLASAPVAVSLGHLGHRTDWLWLRGAVERIPELQLLLIGASHEDERGVGDSEDFRWLRASPQVVWLGPLDDAEAAAVIAQADVGLVPFLVEPFNDAGLPTRILKYARLGRPTVAPQLAGARTWERATTFVEDANGLAAALRKHAGQRLAPDLELRSWALAQTAAHMNAPLHERLAR